MKGAKLHPIAGAPLPVLDSSDSSQPLVVSQIKPKPQLPPLPSDTAIVVAKTEEKKLVKPKQLVPLVASRSDVDLVPLSNALQQINIKALVNVMKPLIEHPARPWTPLILDPTERVDIFFQYSGDYSGLFVDAKKVLVEVLVKKTVTMAAALEELRKVLVNALKHGRTLVIRLGDTATDFVEKFTGADTFPTKDLFCRAGQLFKTEEYWSRVVREEDKDQGQFVVKPDFCVVITSAFQMADYQELLAKAIWLDECAPIYIEPPPLGRQKMYSP
ncbi:hypothetical protein HDU91_004946 [Kappamyces sp. JEL0680]|nr:hypothetical protein HDU91_004946 [Kappamyces sp. JEL0680]